MSIDFDDEILQDFLVEAEEIHESVGENLVDLEKDPEDKDLLNTVFRGFHTIKGGAGFLNITALVELCHVTEDVFNMLRQGDRILTPDLTDIILHVHDLLGDMFEALRLSQEPQSVEQELLDQLKEYTKPVVAEAVVKVEARAEAVVDSATSDDISEDEFEALLDQLHGKGKHGGAPEVTQIVAEVGRPEEHASEDITDDEFEALLDQLHGKGAHQGVVAPAALSAATVVNKTAAEQALPAKKKPELSAKVSAQSTAKAAAKPGQNNSTQSAQGNNSVKKSKVTVESTVRVDTGRLDDIMNMVGELVLVRNRFTTMQESLGDEGASLLASDLDVVTTDLQAAVMKTRMQPIKKVFGRFPRVVRDIARSLGKEIELVMIGEDTDLDKNLVEALADPLVHLVRNSADHGIEMPEVRAAAGKPVQGTITLSAEQQGDHILLTIIDDGAGIDTKKLCKIAVDKGLIDKEAAERYDLDDCYNLLFMPGFSTKEEVTDVSGRGVGMDVVKTSIAKLNGVITIKSELGKGTELSIKVPLTLAIMPTLMVMVGGQIFALPLASVKEILEVNLKKTNIVDKQLVAIIREKALPLYFLEHWLVKNGTRDKSEDATANVVVVHFGTRLVGFVVDKLIGREEIVIKPLGAMLHDTKSVAGATITGDGRIALILDVPGMMATFA